MLPCAAHRPILTSRAAALGRLQRADARCGPRLAQLTGRGVPGAQVVTATGEIGVIEGSFGKSGKFKVAFPDGAAAPAPGASQLTLTFKRYVFDMGKRMVQ